MSTKPTTIPTWATTPGTDAYNNSLLSPPSATKQATGWVIEKPPVQYFNWWMNLVGSWVGYLANQGQITAQYFDAIVTSQQDADGNSLGTDLTLAAALTRVGAGAVILVLETQTLNASLAVTQNDLEIILKPAVGLVAATGTSATSALSVSGTNFRLHGGKVSGWATGVLVTGASAKIFDVDFTANTTDVSAPDDAILYGNSPS